MTKKIYIVIAGDDLPAEVCHGEEKLQKYLAMLDETNPLDVAQVQVYEATPVKIVASVKQFGSANV